MRKKNKSITSPEELNKNLQYSSPLTWIILASVVLLLLGFFAWSFLFKIKEKVSGTASISNGEVTLVVEEKSLDKLKVGQKVYISDLEGEILSFSDNKPVVSSFSLADGDYEYYIVIKEIKPVDFLLGN